MRNSNYDAILFDFDGVLADTEPVHWQCWAEVLDRLGITLTWQTYRDHCIGVSDRHMIEALVRNAPSADYEALWRQYPEKKRRFRELIATHNAITADTIELLTSLTHYRLAVVTSSGKSEVEPVLGRAGILSLLQAAVYGDDVPRLKPFPDPYLMAANLIGAVRPLVVEDSDAGCESGRAAGFDVLRVPAAREMPALVREHLKLRQL